jgi:quinol monooxygenase YgiN
MESRSIVEWTTSDYDAVTDLVRRMIAYMEENEPDTLAFECFGDRAHGRCVWYQVYSNDEAFVKHAQNMAEAGFSDEARALLSDLRVVQLTPITHPQMQAMAQQVGAEQLEPVDGLVR